MRFLSDLLMGGVYDRPVGVQLGVLATQGNEVYHSGIEISPSRKWAATAILIGLVWWGAVLTISTFIWLGADWILKAVTGLALFGSGAMTVLVATRWRSLSLIADSTTVSFGVLVLARNELAAIRIGPLARTRAEFWFGVVVMAIALDLSRKVDFLSTDGRVLLEVNDLYGRAQLVKLASFLSVPFDEAWLRAGPPSAS